MHRFDFEVDKCTHIHFIGIGGISMSGLAQLMLTRGFKVTGSDRGESHITKKLEDMGAVIYYTHSETNITGADLVVHTAAVHMDNPEMKAASECGVRLIDRAEFLGAVMKQYPRAIGVSGTHGKTTTTGMLTYGLIEAGADPTVSIGGELDIIGGNFKVGTDDCFVTEACEYTNSFLKFFPTVSLITNIEEDHLDFFSGIDEIRESFKRFAKLSLSLGGIVVANGDDEEVKRALADVSDIITYGMSDKNTYYAGDIVYSAGYPEFSVYHNGDVVCTVSLNVPGEYNMYNALAVIAVCDSIGFDAKLAAAGVGKFCGTKRRFEKKGMLGAAVVIDDYAHHPTEIRATLSAAKKMPHSRILTIFQPHTYSRTRTLWNDFVTAFDDTDKLIITDIYAAREAFDGVTTAEDLAAAISEHGVDVVYIKDFSDIADFVKSYVSDDDIVFTMGAGTVTELSGYLI